MPYAGQIIRALDFSGDAYDFETANDTSTSLTYVAGTTHGVAFVAPTSGAVWISFGGLVGSNTGTLGVRAAMSDYVRTGSAVGSGTDVLTAADDRAIKYYNASTTAAFRYEYGSVSHKLDGLTPGSSYNVTTVFRAVTGDTAAVDDRWVRVEPAFG